MDCSSARWRFPATILSVLLICSSPAKAGFFDDLANSAEKLRQTAEDLTRAGEQLDPQPSHQPEQEKAREKEAGFETSPITTIDARSVPNNHNGSHNHVALAQGMLNQLGYNVGPVDGAYGQNTRNGIQAYQKDEGLPVHGNVTDELIAHLNQNLRQAQVRSGSKSTPNIPESQSNSSGFVVEAVQNQPGSVSSVVLIPEALLLMKYRPESFEDGLLLRLTESQISRDQTWYRSGGRLKGHTVMFSERDVVGRAPKFAAQELLPVFKTNLGKLAASIPDQVMLVDTIRLGSLEYKNGQLQMVHNGPYKDYLHQWGIVPGSEKENLPGVGGLELVYADLANLKAKVDVSAVSPDIKQLPVGRKGYLALDRTPLVPPIPMSRADAEYLWKEPNCNPYDPRYASEGSGLVGASSSQAARDCQQAQQAYRGDYLEVVYRLNTNNVLVSRRSWIVEANLVAVDVYGTRNELVHSFGAEDLAAPGYSIFKEKPEDVSREKVQQEKNNKDKELADIQARESARSKIAAADIIGLNIGMAFSEAEAAVRGRLGSVRVFESDHKDPDSEIFTDFREFHKDDGTEFITLHRAGPNSETLAAVGRIIQVPEILTWPDIKQRLAVEYGKPTHNAEYANNLVWRFDSENDVCDLRVSWGRNSAIRLVEGSEHHYPREDTGFLITKVMPDTDIRVRNDVLARMEKECSMQIHASFFQQAGRLLVVLVNAPAYAAENVKDLPSADEVSLEL